MSQKFKEKEFTGREFVDSAKEFNGYTIDRCMKLPKYWEKYLTDPLVADTNEIERLVLLANRVYINPEHLTQDQLIQAYKEKDDYLQEALRYLDDFDIKFERMMSYIDVAGHEIKRLKNEMYKIIDELRNEDPKLSEIKIKIEMHKDSMVYKTVNGSVKESLALNSKNLNHWLFLRKETEEWIRKRISWDKTAISKLNA